LDAARSCEVDTVRRKPPRRCHRRRRSNRFAAPSPLRAKARLAPTATILGVFRRGPLPGAVVEPGRARVLRCKIQ